MTGFTIVKQKVNAPMRQLKAEWSVEYPADWTMGNYRFLSCDVVDNVKWYRIRTYTISSTEWVLSQNSNYWYRDDSKVDFWLREELYSMFALRWS